MPLPTMLIYVLIIAACVGIVFVATRAMGVKIPDWVMHILGILLVCVVAIWAIRFLFSL